VSIPPVRATAADAVRRLLPRSHDCSERRERRHSKPSCQRRTGCRPGWLESDAVVGSARLSRTASSAREPFAHPIERRAERMRQVRSRVTPKSCTLGGLPRACATRKRTGIHPNGRCLRCHVGDEGQPRRSPSCQVRWRFQFGSRIRGLDRALPAGFRREIKLTAAYHLALRSEVDDRPHLHRQIAPRVVRNLPACSAAASWYLPSVSASAK